MKVAETFRIIICLLLFAVSPQMVFQFSIEVCSSQYAGVKTETIFSNRQKFLLLNKGEVVFPSQRGNPGISPCMFLVPGMEADEQLRPGAGKNRVQRLDMEGESRG